MRIPRFATPLAALAIAASAAAVAGCGETKIDSDKAQKVIATAVEEQVGADVRSVSCPKDEKAEKGATFTCVVTGDDGTKGNALVTQKDDDGNVRFNAPFIHKDEIEQNLGASFTAKFKSKVTLSCPDIILPRAGAVFVCIATDADGKKAKVDVTQKDDKGNVDAVIRGT